ncbi:GGDEF domain-containing protein [Extibacter muris]|uniref:GGDEF domain-containing protein n=1 Tax=Extibacter muris TaxID=1796622 RepID=UPI001D06C2A5|nr:GGDEF domain-containing protein [Extibacter muris]MCB6201379.1 GGDEF domain-containing protein [Extibacter muris]MCQ4662705.1 GGDEF domain-containing protein [Extibacter muris]MCQ4694180.1 GGDEF domain-containing protein [Extibacter muris]
MTISDKEILSLIVDEGNDVTYLSDIENYKLYFVNRKGLEILGNPDMDEWYGKPCYEVLQNRTSPCPFCTNHLLREDSFYEWNFYNEHMKRNFAKRGTIVNFNGRKTRMEFAIDVTEICDMEKKLKQELEVQKVLIDCALALNRESKEGDESIYAFLNIIRDYYDADRTYIYEINEEKDVFKNTYEVSRKYIKPQPAGQMEQPLSSVECLVEAFRNGQIYSISLPEEAKERESEENKILTSRKIDSLLAAPLVLEGEVLGYLGVDNAKINASAEVLLRLAPEFVINDIKKRQIWQAAKNSGYMDDLTGLGNRKKYRHMIEWLEQQYQGEFGIVTVDIDSLRNINNAYGYAWGDHMLNYVAETMTKCFGDYVYRIGDDEFVAFCLDISKERFEEEVRELQKTAKWDEQLQIAIGSSWYEGECDIDYQITVANEKMHINKLKNYKRGGAQKGIQKYRGVLADNLQREIETGRFVVYLQPQINLKNNEIGGAEALIRRLDEKGNIIFPNSFVSRYEGDEIIRYIDFFVLESVCGILKEWKDKGRQDVGIAVNFSRVTMMEDEVVEKMRSVCKRFGVEPRQITIEVTESIGMLERDTLKELLDDIQKSGFRISLDDFGSRYSDLALLSLADFNEIKLDKSLIDRLEIGGKPRVIAEYVLQMCMELKLTHSVAEGIETVSQREILKNFGCELGQGYLFDKAIPVNEFETKYLGF